MSDRGILRQPAVVMDVEDLLQAAVFWGQLLGVEPGEPRSNGDYLTVGPLSPGVMLVLQRVDDPRRVKNRVHLDFTVDDVDAATQLIIELGGTLLEKRFTGGGQTMAGPDGNEFCIAAYSRDAEGNRIETG